MLLVLKLCPNPSWGWCMLCSTAPPVRQFQVQAKISTVRPIFQTIFPFLMTMLQATLINMPILYALEYMPPYGNFLEISWAESNLCCFFPSLNTVKHRRWNFVQKYFTAWRLQQLFNYLNLPLWWSSAPHLDVWYDWLLILNVTLKAAMLDMMKILVTVNVQKQPP